MSTPATPASTGPFQLSEDQCEIRDMARTFAAARLAPNAIEWDQEKQFPVDVLREAAALGLGGIYVREEHGGSGLSPLRCGADLRGAREGCPTIAAYISIHNMVAWMIDRYGADEQRAAWLPRLCSMEHLRQLLPHRAGVGLGRRSPRDARRARRRPLRRRRRQAVHLGRPAPRASTSSWCARASPGPAASPPSRRPGTPRSLLRRHEDKMGWNAQPTRPVMLEGARVPVANRLGDEGRASRFAHGGPRRRPASTSPPARSAAPRRRSRRRSRYVAEREAVRRAARRAPDRAVPARRHGDRARGRAAACSGARRRRSTRATRARPAVRDGQALRHRRRLRGRQRGASAARRLRLPPDYGIEKLVRDLRVHQILEGTNEIMRLIIARGVVGPAR